ncbi:MAG: CidA/LrgA family protein [Solobacterium sp.]|nr:CidA/LrgA family protein [Solobacterium sp.]
MKLLKQFGIILLVSFIGEVLHEVLPLPVPASIYGIILMFAALTTHVIPLEAVSTAGKYLIEIMAVMFIPAAAGLIVSWDMIRAYWVQYLVLMVVSTVVVMVVSASVTQFVIRKGGRKS